MPPPLSYDVLVQGRIDDRAYSLTQRYDGIHCKFVIEQFRNRLVILRISGTDIGEFGDAPMNTLSAWIGNLGPVDLFIDARDVRGASIEVSGDWAAWLSAHRDRLKSVTMLTGSRFAQFTAEFVRRFAKPEGLMKICAEPPEFDRAIDGARNLS